MARLAAGRWSKWLVVVVWGVVFGVAGSLAGQLTSAQQNDASAWLPHHAESTQVVELAKRFTPGR
jgi:putative drug exporter of the RND superfamily